MVDNLPVQVTQNLYVRKKYVVISAHHASGEAEFLEYEFLKL